MNTERELAEVLALLEKATGGEWHWSENGNIVTDVPNDGCDPEIAAVYTEHEIITPGDEPEPANSAAICAAVNFLRKHGPALLSRADGGEDSILPCDVRLPPATTNNAGCKLSTLLHAMELRAETGVTKFPERNKDQSGGAS